MIEDILPVGAEGEAKFVRRTRPKSNRSALTAAQSLRAKAAAKSTTPTPAFPSSRRSLFAAGTGPKSRNNCPCWVRDGAMKRSVPALRQ
jgi:hypothetical protein